MNLLFVLLCVFVAESLRCQLPSAIVVELEEEYMCNELNGSVIMEVNQEAKCCMYGSAYEPAKCDRSYGVMYESALEAPCEKLPPPKAFLSENSEYCGTLLLLLRNSKDLWLSFLISVFAGWMLSRLIIFFFSSLTLN